MGRIGTGRPVRIDCRIGPELTGIGQKFSQKRAPNWAEFAREFRQISEFASICGPLAALLRWGNCCRAMVTPGKTQQRFGQFLSGNFALKTGQISPVGRGRFDHIRMANDSKRARVIAVDVSRPAPMANFGPILQGLENCGIRLCWLLSSYRG